MKKHNFSFDLTGLNTYTDEVGGLLLSESIVKAQNEVALSQYLPTNNTLLLKDKRVKVKYLTPDTWTDAFKLIKLLWQTRQLV